MLDKPFVLPGVFWDNNVEDLDNAEDGLEGIVSIMDDEIICITASNGIEVRLTLYELEAILEYAYDNEINDIRDDF